MKKPALATLAALAALATFATPLKWVCEWPEARAQSFTLYHGETATFEPSFRVNGSVATNVAVEACYVQTNGMGEAWWRLENATFHPSNDVGAATWLAPGDRLFTLDADTFRGRLNVYIEK